MLYNKNLTKSQTRSSSVFNKPRKVKEKFRHKKYNRKNFSRCDVGFEVNKVKRESINIHSEKEATHSKYKLLFQFTISKAERRIENSTRDF